MRACPPEFFLRDSLLRHIHARVCKQTEVRKKGNCKEIQGQRKRGTKERKKAKITVKARAERVELRCREKGSFLSIPRDIKKHVEKEGPMLAAVGYMLSETSGL